MGLFDWLKPRKWRRAGPTPEGLYGQLPRGAWWTAGPDPAGDPEAFVPEADAYIFAITDWSWAEQVLWIEATAESDGAPAGFRIGLGLSDGSNTDAVEIREISAKGPVLKGRQEWTIPRGHPTRELALVSQGERTTQMLRRLERCFGYQPLAHPALPDKIALVGEFVILRGIVSPDEGRLTARTKVILAEANGWPYCEFFLNINSVRRQIWLSEKSDEYRAAILVWMSDPGAFA